MIDERFEPKSDFEAYMKNAILNKGTTGLPAPQSRMEMLLWELCSVLKNGGTGGGSSSMAWDAITGKPTLFPPETHNHNDLYWPNKRGSDVTDFNTVLKDGRYVVSSGNTIPNGPWTGSIYGVLFVHRRHDNEPVQTFIDATGGSVVVRTWNVVGEEYYPWRFISMGGHNHDESYFKRQSHGLVKDFNTDTQEGKYTVSATTTLPNAPYEGTIYGTLLNIWRNENPTQIFIAANGDYLAMRYCAPPDNQWTKWTSFAKENHIHDGRYVRIALLQNNILDFNQCKANGKFYVASETTIPNAPYTGGIYGYLEVIGFNNEFIQWFVTKPGNDVFVRQYSQDAWKTWRQLSLYGHDHHSSYYLKTEIDKMLEGITAGGGSATPSWDTITGKPETFPPATHNHDGVYATEAALQNVNATKINGKAVWTGTQSEYDGIVEKDPNTLYFVLEG